MVRRADTVRAWALLSAGVSLALVTLPGSAKAQVPVQIPVTVAPQAAAQVAQPSTICANDSNCAYIVVDADTGRVLFEENAQATRHPASITKVMTVYLLLEALESGQVQLDDRIPISRRAAGATPTKLGVRAGSTISVEDAINALMIRSANDVAIAVGEFLGGSEGRFAEMMTQRARELGMSRTTFRNASGLPDSRQVTSAEDLAKLAIAIRRDFPQYYHIFSRTEFLFEGQLITGHNRPLATVDGVDGLKTGFVRASGFNLATTATRGGRRIVVVVLGGNTGAERDAQVAQLVEAGFAEMGVSRSVQAPLPAPVMGVVDARDTVDALNLVPEIPRTALGPAPVRVAGLTTSNRTVDATARPGQLRWAAPRSTGGEVQTAQVSSGPQVSGPQLSGPQVSGPVPAASVPAAAAATPVSAGLVQTAQLQAVPVHTLPQPSADIAVVAPAPSAEPALGPALEPTIGPAIEPVQMAALEAAPSAVPPVVASAATSPAAPTATEVVLADQTQPVPAESVLQPPTSAPVIEFVAADGAPVQLAAAETVSVRTPATIETPVPATATPVQLAAVTQPVVPGDGLRGTRATVGEETVEIVPGLAGLAGTTSLALAVDSAPAPASDPDVGAAPAPVATDPAPVRFAQLEFDTSPITDEPLATTINPEATADLADLFTPPAPAAPVLPATPSEDQPEGTIRLAAAADPVGDSTPSSDVAAAVDVADAASTAGALEAGALNGQVVIAAFDPQTLAVEGAEPATGAEVASVLPATDVAGSNLAAGPVVDGQPVLAPDPAAVEAARRAQAEADARTAQRLADIDAAEAEARRAREAEQRRVAEQRRQEEARRARDEEARRQAEARDRAARDQAAREERERQQRMAQARGNVTVQVGALRGEAQAEDLLAQSRRFFPSFAEGEVTTARTDSGTWFRVRFGGMALEAAQEACRRVTRAGGQCEIVAR